MAEKQAEIVRLEQELQGITHSIDKSVKESALSVARATGKAIETQLTAAKTALEQAIARSPDVVRAQNELTKAETALSKADAALRAVESKRTQAADAFEKAKQAEVAALEGVTRANREKDISGKTDQSAAEISRKLREQQRIEKDQEGKLSKLKTERDTLERDVTKLTSEVAAARDQARAKPEQALADANEAVRRAEISLTLAEAELTNLEVRLSSGETAKVAYDIAKNIYEKTRDQAADALNKARADRQKAFDNDSRVTQAKTKFDKAWKTLSEKNVQYSVESRALDAAKAQITVLSEAPQAKSLLTRLREAVFPPKAQAPASPA